MKKYSTKVEGLDELFYGGIHINEPKYFNDNAKKEDNDANGLIIALHGDRGCYKTMLAMQLMHGLSNSLDKIDINPAFYSLNKKRGDLEDLYFDYVMTNVIYKYVINDIGEKKVFGFDRLFCFDSDLFINTCCLRKLGSIYSILFPNDFCFGKLFGFNPNNCFGNCYRKLFNLPEKSGLCLVECVNNKLIDLLKKKILYYNCRTHTINFNEDKDHTRTILKRKDFESISKYINTINKSINSQSEIEYDDITFLADKFEDKSPLIRFQEILTSLENDNGYSEGKFIPCVVIDGFAQLSQKEQSYLPYPELERALRKKSRVSILVLGDKLEAGVSADIVIEMRKKVAVDEDYQYNELQISKSVFQTAVTGWHQYKKRDFGIEVFPGIHLLLSKRNYLSDQLLRPNRSFIDPIYDDSVKDLDIFQNDNYSKQFLEYIEKTFRTNKNVDPDVVLNKVLSLRRNPDKETKKDKDKIFKCKSQSTALIGNPNSCKRSIAIASTFCAAHNKEQVIYVLFDKDEKAVRRRMVCPFFGNNSCPDYKNDVKNCIECYKRIHFLQIRLGCISAEEFFYALRKQIKKLNDRASCLVVIDDLHKIDFSFPFLKKMSLFLSALITICHEEDVELKIMCDKKADLARQLYYLADNSVCLKRIIKNVDVENINVEEKIDEKDNKDTKLEDRLEIYVRQSIYSNNSGLYKFEANSDDLFELRDSSFVIKTSSNFPIGSMEDFWNED